MYGIEELGGTAAWFVGTWDWNVDKPTAVKTQNKFIQWLRRDMHIPIEYAAVWENTKQGRLHLNLVLSPWSFIDQKTLSRKWVDFGGGFVVWIERVDQHIGPEVSKSYQRLGNYMAKFEQMVLEGRGINYSHGWPKLPLINLWDRKGRIAWVWLRPDYAEAEEFEAYQERGVWAEVQPGEYSMLGLMEDCDCFEWRLRTRPRVPWDEPQRPRDGPSPGTPSLVPLGGLTNQQALFYTDTTVS